MFSQLFWQTGRAQGELTRRDIIKVDTSISCVFVVFCLRPVVYEICCWILYAIVSFKSRYVLNEKQLENVMCSVL